MNELRLKHLEMVQAVVNRLAGNSFTLRGWSIAIVSVILALSVNNSNAGYTLLALFPTLCFWGLDAYYLRQEKLFRALHDTISRDFQRPDDNQSTPLFSMDTTPMANKVDDWFSVLWSPTVVWLHVPILAAVITVTIGALIHSGD